MERIAAVHGAACAGQLGATEAAHTKPIKHLWALKMNERRTCRRCVRRDHIARGVMCLPLGKRRLCAGAGVSLVQWQDWRSGGRGLRSAARGGTCVGVRVRFVAGGENQG